MVLFYSLIALCVALAVALLLTAGKTIRLTLWKRLTVLLFGCAAGVAGLNLMYWIENGSFTGRSFFGAYFFGPLGLLLACLVLRVSMEDRKDLLDLSAICLTMALAIMKLHCYREGCCGGRVLWATASGSSVRFPSQLTEAAFALVLTVVLLRFLRRGNYRGRLLPLAYVVYGAGRFLLNLLREVQPFHGMLPAGNLWALLSVLIGVTALYISYLRRVNARQKHAARRH